jgi:methylglutaconyl-CoA hydratase
MKKIIWEGTDDWDTLLLKRAAVSGELVLSDFTKEALNQFKNKEKCYCSSVKE